MNLFNQKVFDKFMELGGNITMKELGKKFNLSSSHVTRIIDEGFRARRKK